MLLHFSCETALKKELELKSIQTTSKNSSLPPSKDFKESSNSDKPTTPSVDGSITQSDTKKRLKSMGRKGYHRPLDPNPTDFMDVVSDKEICDCGESLCVSNKVHAYDKVNVVITKKVTRVRIYTKNCKSCGLKYKGIPEENYKPGTPFMPNLQKLLSYLRFKQNISYNRLCGLSSDVLGISVSQGALRNYLHRLNETLEPVHDSYLAQIRKADKLGSDETSARLNKETLWQWVVHSHQVVFHTIAQTRGGIVLDNILDGHKPTVWLSDLYNAQQNRATHHQICLAHQVRDCQKAIDQGDIKLGMALKEMFYKAMSYDARDLKLSTKCIYKKKLTSDLTRILNNTTHTTETGRLLVKRYTKHGHNLFTFMDFDDVDATNNASERHLRPSVTFRKVTNGFRSTWGAQLFASVQSVLGTAFVNNKNQYDYFREKATPNSS